MAGSRVVAHGNTHIVTQQDALYAAPAGSHCHPAPSDRMYLFVGHGEPLAAPLATPRRRSHRLSISPPSRSGRVRAAATLRRNLARARAQGLRGRRVPAFLSNAVPGNGVHARRSGDLVPELTPHANDRRLSLTHLRQKRDGVMVKPRVLAVNSDKRQFLAERVVAHQL